MKMHRNKFKLEASITIVLSHVVIFFIAIIFQAKYGFGERSAFDVMSATIPLFGLFLSIIIKDTISGQFDLSSGKIITPQMVWITRIILGSYVIACLLTFLLFGIQSIKTPDELTSWIASIESALGVSLAMLVDSLFGGDQRKNDNVKIDI
ncbi:hypothetical protein [Rhodobium gokarnense]|uniref:Uncharacterized protein n=1 Tax=Rhodobium gokarnense TaxID=364296 RepID=A0ABT3HC72_9HYPH|nr:hypothetical protein [Rhodobium gokarnense]MCW2307949.1 hypothetical protein [Rhodobium gokarnense]